jgi:hypothetical protein
MRPWRAGLAAFVLIVLTGCTSFEERRAAAERERRGRNEQAERNYAASQAERRRMEAAGITFTAPPAMPATPTGEPTPADPVEEYIAAHRDLSESVRYGLRHAALVAGTPGGMTEEAVLLVVPRANVTRVGIVMLRQGTFVEWRLTNQRWSRLYFRGGRLMGWRYWDGEDELY